jgi:drug/metabolite transporter (DMT)-like permease
MAVPVHEIAALSAAACWAVASLVAHGPARELGGFTFNRIRSLIVVTMLAGLASLSGGWSTLAPEHLGALILSGFIGMFVGDTALFAGLRRVGPRRMGVLFATSAPMTAALGFVFLGEVPAWEDLLGCALVIGGVMLAIVHGGGGGRGHTSRFEATDGPLGLGVLIGLLAALCQAVGIVIAKPAMASGVDAVAASALRVGAAALCLVIGSRLPIKQFQPINPVRRRHVLRITVSGFLGMALGMTLLLYALEAGDAAVVVALSSTAPVVLLPILWLRTRERPAPGAWAGAILVVIGTAIVLRP